MAFSATGIELWPPGLRTSSRKVAECFSATWTRLASRFPSRISPQPPSLRHSSASISSRRFASSQATPL